MEVLHDSPLLARPYCPACEPNADPRGEILDVRWCDSHTPDRGGLDDGSVPAGVFPSGSMESGGDDNRKWCEIVHRQARR